MKSKEVYIVIVSILFGIVAWLAVEMGETRVITLSAPLSLDQMPEGKAIRTAFPSHIQVKLEGTGWHLAAMLWTADKKLEFPISAFHGSKQAITMADVAEKLCTREGIQLVSMSPDSVYVGLDRAVAKTVPIVFRSQITCREGYGQVGLPLLVPDSVVVRGAEELLKTIDSWPTVAMVFDNVKSAIEADVPLAQNPGYKLTVNVSQVRVKVSIEPIAEKTFGGLPVEPVAVAPNRELILIPPKIDIVVRGGIKQLSNLNNEDFRAYVNYASIVADSSGSVQAEIDSPPGVQVVRKKPERMQFVVRKRP